MPPVAPAPVLLKRLPLWRRLYAPPPAAPLITDPETVQTQCRFWQGRVLLFATLGYTVFYFVRKNLSVAMPLMEHDLGISKSSLGLFLTLHGVLYGVSKFANGFFGDRCNARAFMVTGLIVSALMNVFFGLSSAVATLGVVWMLNGWFQGMGFPPCARLMSHWFSPKEFAMKMSIWNISHSVGAGLILVFCAYVLAPVHWRLCFLVPAGIALACAGLLARTLPDTPASVGLPEVEGTQGALPEPTSAREYREVLMETVFRNKAVWLVSITNFFVYTLRYAVLDWGPTLLKEAKHLSIGNASLMVAGFELFGVMGGLAAGWLTDRFFGGRPMRVGVFYMVLAGISLLLFWKVAGESRLWTTALLCSAGFFIYGPQCLIGITAAKLATKRGAATAIGLTGFFGYLSTLLSGWGLGTLVQYRGWDAGFAGLMVIALIGTVLFIAAWPTKADGYRESPAN
jgi:sugar phosphate permease